MVLFPAADAVASTLSGEVAVAVIVWARFLGSGLLITPLYLASRLARPDRQAICLEVLRAAIFIAAFGSFVTAFETISFAEAMTYYSFAPIVAAALAVLILKERMTAAKTLALLLGLAGVAIALNPSVTPAAGAYFAMFTGCLYGSYLFLNRVVATRLPPVQALFLQFWAGSVLLLPLVWPHLAPSLTAALPGLAAIAAVSLLSNMLLINAFRLAEASFLAPFMFVEIPSALAIAVLFLGETPAANLLAGAALILLAGCLTLVRRP